MELRPSPATLNAPQPLVVEHVDQVDGRRPIAVWWRGQRRRVQAIVNVWRVDDGWWRAEIRRQYFDVQLEAGPRVTIFENCLSGEWFTHRGER